MPIRRLLSLVVLLVVMLVVGTPPLVAQVRADPGTVINGRVAVRVYVTLSDEETPYAPIGGVSLRFFRTTADTAVAARTDDAGTVTVLLQPGEYRLMSTSAVDWKGARYSWSQLVQVRAGLPTIELTAGVAERAEVPAQAAVTVTGRGPVSPPAADVDASIVHKDPAMATMLSFFLTGAGQMYSGERAKGSALLMLTAVGVGVAARQLSCATASDCESTTGGLALGAAGTVAFFGSWIYSIVDAGDAARRFNSSHGLIATGVKPFVAPAGGGRTRLGLAVALPR